MRPYLPIPRKSLFRSPQLPGPYDHLFDRFGRPVEGIISELPKHYLKLLQPTPPPNVHWRPVQNKIHIDSRGRNKIQAEKYYHQAMWAPIPVLFPLRSRRELWGGEGIVFGYVQKGKHRPTRHIWYPKIEAWTFYSEILDENVETVVSDRTLDLVDECCGFDFYILKTPPHQLLSDLGMEIKGKLLRSLAREDYWLENDEMKRYVKEKYEEFVIEPEEADWVGLSPEEAIFKLQMSKNIDYRPLKEIYADEMRSEETELVDKIEGKSSGFLS